MKARSTLLIGCGPANLALLTCLAEEQSHVLADLQLFERREDAAWHPGLELEGSVLQVPQFHDLAFFRNPASPYTIFSFLRERGLLHQYVNANYLYPTRKLFSEYLAWASARFAQHIRFGKEVERIRAIPAAEAGSARLAVQVTDRSTGATTEEVFDDLVLGLGHEPYIPPCLAIDDRRVLHASCLLDAVAEGYIRPSARIAVVGAGQSAGEVVRFLLRDRQVSEISVVGRRYLFTQVDDNPFTNDSYTFPASQDFAALDPARQLGFLADMRNTNFSCVRHEVLQDIYRLALDDRIAGRDRLRLRSYTQIVAAEALREGIRVTMQSGGMSSTMDVDLVICATGYRNIRHLPLLAGLGIARNEGDVRITSSFEVEHHLRGPRIFLMNHSMLTRGPTEHTLTGLAERAGLVAGALAACHGAATAAPGADPTPQANAFALDEAGK